ncbi:hypothetical protein C0J52_17680 [Blattella germanica]|nr:hypothetical protein C0J52_17680 [Blattella germanica]
MAEVQEVIDALEMQLDAKLEDAVKGVRVVNGNCFVCLNKENSVEALLRTGLTIRGEQLTLEEASRGYVLVSASGVPYDVSDDALAKALSQHCSVLDFNLTGETCAKPENSAKPMENSFATDRFRSQISVRLKQPNPKSNRSLDNIFDTSSPKQIHNTSLPIIGAYDNSSYIDQGRQAMIQDRAHNIGSVDTCFQPYSRNFLKDPPNIFSEIPIRKAQDQTLQLPNIMDDSTESVDVFTQPAHQFQSNPFVGNFPTSTPVTAVSVNPFIPSATYTTQPIHQYTSHEHQRQAFLPQTTSNARICSPYPFMNSPAQYAAHLPNSGIPSPNLTPQNSPQVNKTPYFPPDNSNYLPNPVPPTNPPNPGFLIPASYYTGDVPSQPPNLSVSNPALNIIPAQQSSNAPSSQVNHSTQNIANEVKPHDVPDTVLDRSKHQSSSMPSSPITGRRKKPSILSHQHSKSSGDEGPRSSPGAARRKISRKQSSTNSIKSHHSVDASGGPNATSSPNTKHKTSVTHSRKTSGGVSSSGEATGGSQTNVVDVSRSSSSGQDSPTKPDRRRRVSIYFNKKGAGILTRSISLEAAQRCTGGSTTDVATGHSAGAETTTCSDRERTNSASSRTSSATGTSRLRKHSECSNRGSSIADVGKVPWCGCWGNGCL